MWIKNGMYLRKAQLKMGLTILCPRTYIEIDSWNMTHAQKCSNIKKLSILLQTNLYSGTLPTQELVILTKFHYNIAKIVNFLLWTHLWECVKFFAIVFSQKIFFQPHQPIRKLWSNALRKIQNLKIYR